MEWEPDTMEKDTRQRYEFNDAKTSRGGKRTTFRERRIDKDSDSFRQGREERLREHSVRSCPACGPREAERLLKQRKWQTEKNVDVVTKIKKAAIRNSSCEVTTTLDEIPNIGTLLDSGVGLSHGISGSGKSAFQRKFFAIKYWKPQ
uniref:AlNc14C536G12087 protein n=1 Tax=Albugo laibachii Nc14 TaxID=890382 RepID=F0X100_9STRA|nr:AlNc14C536G12087 [Albugo laibachii Nc14]|eukprot:CCA27446.1 AlNc14C536G12087 [Albugo laibachii Nc14]